MSVCPDSAPDAEDRGCWTTLALPEGVNVVSWLKAEMVDGLDHEWAHAALGPFIYGFDKDGVPNFEVFRDESGRWAVRGKEGWKPAELKGIIQDRGVERKTQMSTDPVCYVGGMQTPCAVTKGCHNERCKPNPEPERVEIKGNSYTREELEAKLGFKFWDFQWDKLVQYCGVERT